MAEMDLQRDFFEGGLLETIYFGGGTPSLLPNSEIAMLLNHASKIFGIQKNAEITLEANPEDVTQGNLAAWKQAGVNRLSMGIQTLDDAELIQMNRNHNSKQAMASVDLALQSGIHSINVDLIFGSPWLSDAQWQDNMAWAFGSGADHISAYGLTIEPKTLLNKKTLNGSIPALDDEKQARQYTQLHESAAKHSWDFYEISNLSKPGHRAVHNSNYWKNKPYLGIGPSAHSFKNTTRHWNVADNARYMDMANQGHWHFESEQLSAQDLLNEYLLTHLRMIEGIEKNQCEKLHAGFWDSRETLFEHWTSQGWATCHSQKIQLTLKGRLLGDTLTAEAML